MSDNILEFKTMAQLEDELPEPPAVVFKVEGQPSAALEGFNLISSLGKK